MTLIIFMTNLEVSEIEYTYNIYMYIDIYIYTYINKLILYYQLINTYYQYLIFQFPNIFGTFGSQLLPGS